MRDAQRAFKDFMPSTTAIARPVGRPPTYDSDFADWARKFARLGSTEQDLADAFGVSVKTIRCWKDDIPEFGIALKEGKERSDAEVAHRLYTRATGYSRKVVKALLDREGNEMLIEYEEEVPPDTTACIFWLKNRRSDLWRDKREHEHTGKNGGPIDMTLGPSEAYRRLREG
jgi:hypothetical protein